MHQINMGVRASRCSARPSRAFDWTFQPRSSHERLEAAGTQKDWLPVGQLEWEVM
jgi:hypothetical protein